MTCKRCGCTPDNPCPGGCAWSLPDVCTRCVTPDEQRIENQYASLCNDLRAELEQDRFERYLLAIAQGMAASPNINIDSCPAEKFVGRAFELALGISRWLIWTAGNPCLCHKATDAMTSAINVRAAIVARLMSDWSHDPDLTAEKVRQLAMWAGASVRSLLHEIGTLRDITDPPQEQPSSSPVGGSGGSLREGLLRIARFLEGAPGALSNDDVQLLRQAAEALAPCAGGIVAGDLAEMAHEVTAKSGVTGAEARALAHEDPAPPDGDPPYRSGSNNVGGIADGPLGTWQVRPGAPQDGWTDTDSIRHLRRLLSISRVYLVQASEREGVFTSDQRSELTSLVTLIDACIRTAAFPLAPQEGPLEEIAQLLHDFDIWCRATEYDRDGKDGEVTGVRLAVFDAHDLMVRFAASLARLQEEIASLKADYQRFARFIVTHVDPTRFKDHACAKCSGTIIREGFVCSYHVALAALQGDSAPANGDPA